MLRLHPCLVTAVLIPFLIGCTQDSVRNQLHVLADQLRTTEFADTSVWSRVALARTDVIEHNCSSCDSVYNSLVADIGERNLHSIPGPHKYFHCLRSNSIQRDDGEPLLHTAHDLRFWGSFNAARSMYIHSRFIDIESADVYGNVSMEYMRLGLYRSALQSALIADSLFMSRDNYRGRIWTERLLYEAYSRLGLRSKALACLDSLHMFRFNTMKATSWRTEDTITDFNLARSILSQDGNIQDSDFKRAFGTAASDIRTRFATYQDTQTDHQLGVFWNTSGLRWKHLPLPIFRKAEYSQLKIWIDSIGSHHGKLKACTRFGSFILEGDTWTNILDPASKIHVQASSLPIIDTLFIGSSNISGVLPLPQGNLIAVTANHFVIIESDSIDKRDLPRELTGENSPVDILSTPSGELLVSTLRGVYLLDNNSFAIRSRLEFNPLNNRPLFFPNSTSFIHLIDSDNAVIKQGRSSNLWGIKIRQSEHAIEFAHVLGKQGHFYSGESSSMWQSIWQRFEGLSSPAAANEFGDTIHVYEHSATGLETLDLSVRSDRRLTGRYSLPSPLGLIALRVLDGVDVVDTANCTVYPQHAVPFPATQILERNIGIYRDRYFQLYGYFCDGRVVVRFPLSQRGFPLAPTTRIINTSSNTSPIELTDEIVLEAGQHYKVFTESNLITSAYNVVAWKNDGDSNKSAITGGTHFWQVLLEPSETDSVYFVKVPATGRTYRLAVHTPFFKRPWVVNSTYPLAVVLVIGSALFGILRYRQRQQEKIHEAKSQQLELIREDMHDMIGSRLVRIASLARQTKPEDADAALARIHDMTLVTVRSLRNLLSLMSETTMTDAEFFGALREYVVESCTDAALIPTVIVNTIDDKRTNLDGGDRHELMMIVSEMLANTLRHAQARTVTFSILSDAFGITLEWQDDGIGIAPSSQRGNGLNNIQRRAARLDATVNLVSHPGSGTQYTISIPIQAS